MKAILVIDMPSSCDDCQICRGIATDGDYVCSILDKDGNEQGFYDGEYDRPNYCPLRELPKKLEVKDDKSMSEMLVKDGYNACIDELLGGAE